MKAVQDTMGLCPRCHKEADYQNQNQPKDICPWCQFPLMLVADKYRLQKILDEGNMGQVYLAHHVRLTRDPERVVKVMKPKVLSRPGTVERFLREVRVTAALSQQNDHIVKIYDDFGEESGLGYYYVMEYLDGQSLKKLIKPNEPLERELIFHIFEQICLAMRLAHAEDVVHRDLKPENIFLIRRDNDPFFAKIIDFGIAKPLHRAIHTGLTQGAIGTPDYMAPEQCLNLPVDSRCDIYAMGVILYELLSGTTPFAHLGKDALITMHAQVSENPIPIRELRPDLDIPEGLDRVVLCALEKNPDDRYNSVEEFWNALVEYYPDEFDDAYLLSLARRKGTIEYGILQTEDDLQHWLKKESPHKEDLKRKNSLHKHRHDLVSEYQKIVNDRENISDNESSIERSSYEDRIKRGSYQDSIKINSSQTNEQNHHSFKGINEAIVPTLINQIPKETIKQLNILQRGSTGKVESFSVDEADFQDPSDFVDIQPTQVHSSVLSELVIDDNENIENFTKNSSFEQDLIAEFANDDGVQELELSEDIILENEIQRVFTEAENDEFLSVEDEEELSSDDLVEVDEDTEDLNEIEELEDFIEDDSLTRPGTLSLTADDIVQTINKKIEDFSGEKGESFASFAQEKKRKKRKLINKELLKTVSNKELATTLAFDVMPEYAELESFEDDDEEKTSPYLPASNDDLIVKSIIQRQLAKRDLELKLDLEMNDQNRTSSLEEKDDLFRKADDLSGVFSAKRDEPSPNIQVNHSLPSKKERDSKKGSIASRYDRKKKIKRKLSARKTRLGFEKHKQDNSDPLKKTQVNQTMGFQATTDEYDELKVVEEGLPTILKPVDGSDDDFLNLAQLHEDLIEKRTEQSQTKDLKATIEEPMDFAQLQSFVDDIEKFGENLGGFAEEKYQEKPSKEQNNKTNYVVDPSGKYQNIDDTKEESIPTMLIEMKETLGASNEVSTESITGRRGSFFLTFFMALAMVLVAGILLFGSYYKIGSKIPPPPLQKQKIENKLAFAKVEPLKLGKKSSYLTTKPLLAPPLKRDELPIPVIPDRSQKDKEYSTIEKLNRKKLHKQLVSKQKRKKTRSHRRKRGRKKIRLKCGKLYYKKKMKRAITCYKRLLRRGSKNSYIYVLMGFASASLGHCKKPSHRRYSINRCRQAKNYFRRYLRVKSRGLIAEQLKEIIAKGWASVSSLSGFPHKKPRKRSDKKPKQRFKKPKRHFKKSKQRFKKTKQKTKPQKRHTSSSSSDISSLEKMLMNPTAQ